MKSCIYLYNKRCNHPKVKNMATFEFEVEEDCGKCLYRKEAVSICDFCKNGDNPNEDDCYGCVAELKEQIVTAYNKDCAVTVDKQPSPKPDKSGFAQS